MNILDGLNNMQKEAVCHIDGPLLILAGAGSGKTKVITHRIANLIYNCNVKPYNIMAITFTNKAASEMKERTLALLNSQGQDIWISTFHSSCVRILRRYIDRLGYTKDFTIYDSEDSKSIIRQIIKSSELDPKFYKDKVILSQISQAKNKGIKTLGQDTNANYRDILVDIYNAYNNVLRSNNALDFDDLLLKTVTLLKENEDVRDYYNDLFHYVMIDEYQDTNDLQFQLIRLLTLKRKNICVVGDDDQSIYKFRGANITNILDFERNFQDAKVIKLEQNYRSTKVILDSANSVIKNNNYRKDKALWTTGNEGNKILVGRFENSYKEAEEIVAYIEKDRDENHHKLNDYAILYRTNAQSRILEEKFISKNIPYKLVGGISFYSRKEIKDILSYLRVLANPRDNVSIRRIINVPKRGIGDTTLEKLSRFANENEISIYEACISCDMIDEISLKTKRAINDFIAILDKISNNSQESIGKIIEDIISKTGYIDELNKDTPGDAKDRIENLNEFITKAYDFDENTEEHDLAVFLEEVALISDIDKMSDNDDSITLMTLHSSKGLEFDTVFIVGMEDSNFPSYYAISCDDESELEEERRLFYVGITRAKKQLILSSSKIKMTRGEKVFCKESRFIEEIPLDNIERLLPREKPQYIEDTNEIKKKGNFYGNRELKSFYNVKPEKPSENLPNINFTIGDKVKHMRFGVGTVLDIKYIGRDHEVTVNFDKFGEKKLFAALAKLTKV